MNCFGIKQGNTAPCARTSTPNNFCIYDSPAESFEAFKIIWPAVYGNRFPTTPDAIKWTGNDNPSAWLSNVSSVYYN